MRRFRHNVQYIDDGLSIVLRNGKKPVWYAVVKHGGKETTRSTKCYDLSSVIDAAKTLRNDVVDNILSGKKSIVTFETASIWFLESLAGTDKAINPTYQIRDYLTPYFGSLDLKSITDLHIAKYQAKRRDEGLHGSSFNNEMTTLRHVFKIACPHYMQAKDVPTIPRDNTKGKAKPAFETHEVARILKAIWDRRKTTTDHAAWDNYYRFFMLLTACGCCPSSLERVRVGAVRKVRGHYVLDMTSNKGKSVKRGTVVPMRFANRVMRQLMERHKNSKRDTFLFDQHAKGYYTDTFERIRDKIGIRFDAYGQSRTIYSIRHWYISYMLRRKRGINVVAANTLTSYQMIEKHYDKNTALDFMDQLT